MIVLELAGSRVRIGFWAFFRIGTVVTAATLAVGLGLLLAERTLGLIRGPQVTGLTSDSGIVPRRTHPGIGAEPSRMRNTAADSP